MKRILTNTKALHIDAGLLLLRVFVGLTMLFSHGWGKMMRMLDGDFGFADVMGIGEAPSLMLAVFAEVICSLFLALGLFTRFSLVPLIITMLVAVFYIHGDDPFAKQEFGLLFLIPYVTLFLTGPGKFSLDAKLNRL
ncbi:MAG: DoxX family protein [Flavobacteriales bacterium]|nr:DoxX family protein [Flavobacteriales bacterium]